MSAEAANDLSRKVRATRHRPTTLSRRRRLQKARRLTESRSLETPLDRKLREAAKVAFRLMGED